MAKLRSKIANIALGDVISRGIGFITTVYLARILGAESYGLVTIALSVLGYQIWLSDLGLLNIGTRETAKEPIKRMFRAKEIFIAKIILGLLVFGLSYLLIPSLDLSELQRSLILGFTFSLIPYAFLMEWYFSGRQKFGKVAVSRIINSSVYFILIYFFIRSEADIEWIPMLYTAGITCSALVIGIICIFDKPFELPVRGWNIFKDLFKSASTLGIGWFFTQSIQLLPPIAIGLLLSEYDAGLYGAAIRIIFAAMILDRIFVNLLLPNLSSQWTENRMAAKLNIEMVSKVMLTAGALLGILIAVSAPFIIDIIYGDEYSLSSGVLSILSMFLFLTFLNSLFSFGLVAIGKDREFFYSTLTGGIFTLLFVLGSTILNDLNTVTFAVIISEFMFVIASYYWFRRFVQLKIVASFLITLISGFGVYYLSTVTEYHVLLEGIVSVFILFAILLITGIFTGQHYSWMKEKVSG